MRRLSLSFLAVLVVWLLPTAAAISRGSHGGASPALAPSLNCGTLTVPPPQAAAVGYTRCEFAFGVGTGVIPTVDTTDSKASGFSLYFNHSDGGGFSGAGSYSINGSTGAVTVTSPLMNPNAAWQLATNATYSTTAAAFPIVGHILSGGYYVEGSLTYNRDSFGSPDRNAFWGITYQVSEGWELDNPDIVGFGRNIAHWVGSSVQNETTLGSPDVGGVTETNHAFGALATPSAVTFYDNGTTTANPGVNFTSGGGSPQAMVGQVINFGIASGMQFPTTLNAYQVWKQPFLDSQHAFGDQLGLSPTLWPNAVTSTENLAQTVNTSLNSETMCSATQNQIFANENPGSLNPIYTILLGGNDAAVSTTQANFDACTLGAFTWLGVPQSNKVLAQSGCIASGSWTNDNSNLVTGIGKKSSTTGDTITCTVTAGGSTGPNAATIYAWWRRCPTCNGINIFLNGSGPISESGVSAGPGGDFVVARFTGGTPGMTYAVEFQIGTGGSGGATTVVGAGIPPYSNCCRVQAGGVFNPSTCNVDSTTGTYDGYLQADIATLQLGEGMPISYVPTRSYVNGTNCATKIAQAMSVMWP